MLSGRGRTWDWLTAAAGLVLVVSLFLPWFDSNQETPTGISAMGLVGKLLLFIGLFAMAAPIVATLRQTPGDVQRYTIVLAAFAAVGLILAIIRTNDPPEFDTVQAPVSVEAGAYLGCVAVGVILLLSLAALRSRLAGRPARSAA